MKKLTVLIAMLFAIASLSAQITGNLIMERWTGSMSLEALSSAENPDATLTIYELGHADPGDNYMARIRGYIIPDVTGEYIFWVSSDDDSEFWLSSDYTAENKELAAFVPGYASAYDFTKYPEQKSEMISLVAGESYYFELLHHEATGGEHAEVAWTLPGEAETVRNVVSATNISQTTNNDQSLKNILDFEFTGLADIAFYEIDNINHTIDIDVSYADDPTALTSEISVSAGASINPASGSTLDYTNPVVYTVTAADASTQDFTVTVTQIPLQTGNLVTKFYLDPLDQEAVIDDDAGTITYDYFVGYTESQVITLETSLYSTDTLEGIFVIDVTDPPSKITVTAQNGDEKTYSIIANGIVGIQGFTDDFSTADNIAGWINNSWQDPYEFSHDAAGERLQLQMNKQNWCDANFIFPDSLNLYNNTYVRMRLISNKLVNNPGVQIGLVDAEGNGQRDWRTNLVTKINVPNEVYEIDLDFSSKFEQYDHVELGNIQMMYFDVNRGNIDNGQGSDALIFIDDFRVGVEALPNKAPSIDQPQSPDWTYITGGPQSVSISGLDDGNPERDELITLSAKSSDQSVVKDEDIIITYDGFSATAEISYTGTDRGFAAITVYAQDDRASVYSDENDIDSVQFVAQFRDNTPGVNNLATFGIPYIPDYFLNTGQNVIIIPNVDDGDEGEVQEVIFTYNNLNPEIITIDSLVYYAGDKFAIIYFTELGVGGSAMIELSSQDKVDLDAGGDDIFTLTFSVAPSLFDNPGANYGATDVLQWQPEPYKTSVVFKEGYPIIWPNADIQDHLKEDFFWGKMWGYIIPPESGSYQFFSSTEGEGIGNFYLSADYQYDNLPDLQTAANGSPSSEIALEKGKPYYFEAYHKEIINDYHLTISWAGPGFAQTTLAPPYLVSNLDLEKPTTPGNFTMAAIGTNEAIVSWDAASDDGEIGGYIILLDGFVYMDTVFRETSVNIKGLEAETSYQVTVLSLDMFRNHSLPAKPLNFTTWPVDAIPPGAPGNAAIADYSIYSATVSWDAAVDGETDIFGYNIYMDGSTSPVNPAPVQTLQYKVTGLQPATSFSFEVTALDASQNESVKSNAAMVMTKAFSWDDEDEEEQVGQVDVTLHAMTKSTGFAVEGSEHLGSFLVSNKVSYNTFESQFIKNGATVEDLNKVQKESSNVSIYAETEDPFAGSQSLKLTTSNGGYFRNSASIKMSPLYTYLVKFAAKKGSNYGSEAITLRVLKTTGGTVVAHSSTVSGLTTEWQEFEIEFTGMENALQSWWVEWGFGAAGDVYFDNVEMHIKDFYEEGNKFTTVGMETLKDLDVAGMRWGGIDANYLSLYNSAGPNQTSTLTFGDFVHISNQLGGYALLCTGIHDGLDADGNVIGDPTDFFSSKTTYSQMMEYLGGDGSTEWGAKRIAEGYTNSLIEESNGIVLEFGNEVWGNTHGVITFANDYNTYTEWSQDVAQNYVKASPYYNSEKVFTSISGRSPDQSWGLNESIYGGTNDDIDWISLSGYMGGNLDYEAGVDPGRTELEYHKNGYDNFYSKISGLTNNWKLQLDATQRIWPIYMYEGNMTTPTYHGSLGQAITFGDYYATAMENGVVLPSVFALEGGQWRLIDDLPTLRKRPMYYVTKLFNNTSRGGVVLETNVHSRDSLYNAAGEVIGLPSIGAHAYANGEEYSVVLFSRNFESNYHVMVNLPDDIGTISGAKIYTLTGESHSSSAVTLDTADIVISDSMLVTIPKHSMVVLQFMADDKSLDAPLGYSEIDMIESIEVTTEDDITELDGKGVILEVYAEVTPADAFFTKVEWSVLNNEDDKVRLYGTSFPAKIKTMGIADGVVTVVATTLDGSNLSDEVDITLINQTVGIEEKMSAMNFKLYPNPATEKLYIEIPQKEAEACIYNIQGAELQNVMLYEGRNTVDLSKMQDGVYIVKLKTSNGVATERFVKQ